MDLDVRQRDLEAAGATVRWGRADGPGARAGAGPPRPSYWCTVAFGPAEVYDGRGDDVDLARHDAFRKAEHARG